MKAGGGGVCCRAVAEAAGGECARGGLRIVCLDLEGVLVPEIWVALAERTGVDALRATTRDMPDYDALMAHRLGVLDDHGLGLPDLRAAAAGIAPFESAPAFLDGLRKHAQIAILSDSFYELAGPLMARLGNPMLLCHSLRVEADGRVAGYAPRQDDPKRRDVVAFQSLAAHVVAAGDSYNDVSMLEQADAGFFFRPSDPVRRDHPQFPVCHDHAALRGRIEAAWSGAAQTDEPGASHETL